MRKMLKMAKTNLSKFLAVSACSGGSAVQAALLLSTIKLSFTNQNKSMETTREIQKYTQPFFCVPASDPRGESEQVIAIFGSEQLIAGTYIFSLFWQC